MQELTINLPKIARLRGISPYPVFWALSTTWDYIGSSSRHILAVLKYIPKSQQKEQTLRQRRKTCYYHLETHHSHTDDAVYNLLNVCSNRTTFKTTQDKNPKHAICNLYFWYTCAIEAKSRSSNLESQHPRQCFNHAKFERSCLKVSEKKPMLKVVVVFQMRKYANYLPWTCAKSKIAVYLWSTWRNIHNTILSHKVKWSALFLLPSSSNMTQSPRFYRSRILSQFLQIFLKNLSLFETFFLQSLCTEVPVCVSRFVFVCGCECVCKCASMCLQFVYLNFWR